MPEIKLDLRAATIIVAASNSLHRNMADYVCDGVADQIEINAALAALPASGGRVLLLEGTYTITASITPVTNSTLSGVGLGTLITIPNGHNADLNLFNVNAVSRVLIEDIQIDGNQANQAAGTMHAINVAGASSLRVMRCYIHDLRNRGVYSSNGSGWIVDCTFANFRGGEAIREENGSWQIIGNQVNAAGWLGQYSIAVYSSNVLSNDIYPGAGSGGGGIALITGPSPGINQVIGNKLGPCDLLNISVEQNSAQNRIQGNTIHEGNLGLISAVLADELKIIGNQFCGPAAGNGQTMLLDRCNYASIVGNTLNGSRRNGIYLWGCRNCAIVGNKIKNSGAQTNNTYADIYLAPNGGSDSVDNVVADNVFYADGANKVAYHINDDSGGRNTFIGNRGNTAVTADFRFPGLRCLAYTGHTDLFMDIVAGSNNHVVAAQDLTAATPIVCVIAAQPDVPRNVTIAITDADVSITAFSITVAGVDARGNTVSENFVLAGGLNQIGNVAFASITSVTVNSITGANAGDVLNVGIGSKLGLTNLIYLTGDVYKVKKNNAHYAAASYTVNVANSTVDVSTGGAVVVGDDFSVFYRSNLNGSD